MYRFVDYVLNHSTKSFEFIIHIYISASMDLWSPQTFLPFKFVLFHSILYLFVVQESSGRRRGARGRRNGVHAAGVVYSPSNSGNDYEVIPLVM